MGKCRAPSSKNVLISGPEFRHAFKNWSNEIEAPTDLASNSSCNVATRIAWETTPS